ncbi:MAG: STAS domain-containing protein [bacterium]|nr:STAS domain-containing protein [bacterium]
MVNLVTEQHGPVTIVHARGKCDFRIAGAIETTLEAELENLKVMGVNCRRMTNIDNIAICGLMRAHTFAKKNNIEFIVFGLNKKMEQVFETNNWNIVLKPISKQKFEQTYSGV